MRFQYGLLTLIVLTGCTKPRTSESQLTDKVDSVVSEPLIRNGEDTSSYIGYIEKFEDNNSFYTDLYFIDNFNYDLYEEVARIGDKIIFKDDEIRRTRMEIEKVGQYFNLSGLKRINIYNGKNQKLTTGQLSHIEYIEDLIENRFVAVFQVDNPSISGHLFCIGNSTTNISETDFSSFDNEKLRSDLIDFLKISQDRVWNVGHYKLDNQIISTLSSDTTSYIIETVDNSHQTLYQSKYSESIHGLAVVSKKINGRQILLTASGMPETDMTWTSVLIFNGTEYETSKDHRIRNR